MWTISVIQLRVWLYFAKKHKRTKKDCNWSIQLKVVILCFFFATTESTETKLFGFSRPKSFMFPGFVLWILKSYNPDSFGLQLRKDVEIACHRSDRDSNSFKANSFLVDLLQFFEDLQVIQNFYQNGLFPDSKNVTRKKLQPMFQLKFVIWFYWGCKNN